MFANAIDNPNQASYSVVILRLDCGIQMGLELPYLTENDHVVTSDRFSGSQDLINLCLQGIAIAAPA